MMAVQTIKESVFAEDFHKLIAGSNEPAALQKLRREAFEIFVANGFPTPRREDWKYTNVASIVGEQWSVAGKSAESPSDLPVELLRKFNFERNGFAALHLAFAEISVIRIPKETSVEEPFEISLPWMGCSSTLDVCRVDLSMDDMAPAGRMARSLAPVIDRPSARFC